MWKVLGQESLPLFRQTLLREMSSCKSRRKHGRRWPQHTSFFLQNTSWLKQEDKEPGRSTRDTHVISSLASLASNGCHCQVCSLGTALCRHAASDLRRWRLSPFPQVGVMNSGKPSVCQRQSMLSGGANITRCQDIPTPTASWVRRVRRSQGWRGRVRGRSQGTPGSEAGLENNEHRTLPLKTNGPSQVGVGRPWGAR